MTRRHPLFLFGYDRWATTRILDAADRHRRRDVVGARTSIGERGLGGILVHHLGAYQRWRHGLSGRRRGRRAPEDEPLPGARRRCARRWDARVGLATDAWLDRLDRRLASTRTDDGVAVLAGARPCRQPRDAASVRGRRPC